METNCPIHGHWSQMTDKCPECESANASSDEIVRELVALRASYAEQNYITAAIFIDDAIDKVRAAADYARYPKS